MEALNKKEYLAEIDRVIARGKYKDTWESLQQYQPPRWYREAKFGVFIHWGAYAVPAFGSEWYPRNMYIQGSPEYEHHLKTYGPHKEFGYKDFIPLFRAEKFDPKAWAALFKEAGAQYVVPVAEHHDGFQMYKSDISHWNAWEMGPRRDILGELSESVRALGMEMGASSHRVEHWFFMGHGRDFESDVTGREQERDLYWPAMPEADLQDIFSQPEPSREFLEDWLVRCCELVDRYAPRLVYFDWWIQHRAVKPYLRKFAAYYYDRAEERGTDAVINYKFDAFQFGTAIPDVERGQFADAKPYLWQTDTAVAKNSWCYTEGNVYKAPRDILCDLVDIVSKNGRMLLNIGPKADGTIPEEDARILREIGGWLKVNGEAIYGSKLWRCPAEGPTVIKEGPFADDEGRGYTSADLRFTVNGGSLYAAVLSYPEDGHVTIAHLAEAEGYSQLFKGIIRDVSVLGFDEKPAWHRDKDGLHLHTETVRSEYPVVFKLELA